MEKPRSNSVIYLTLAYMARHSAPHNTLHTARQIFNAQKDAQEYYKALLPKSYYEERAKILKDQCYSSWEHYNEQINREDFEALEDYYEAIYIHCETGRLLTKLLKSYYQIVEQMDSYNLFSGNLHRLYRTNKIYRAQFIPPGSTIPVWGYTVVFPNTFQTDKNHRIA